MEPNATPALFHVVLQRYSWGLFILAPLANTELRQAMTDIQIYAESWKNNSLGKVFSWLFSPPYLSVLYLIKFVSQCLLTDNFLSSAAQKKIDYLYVFVVMNRANSVGFMPDCFAMVVLISSLWHSLQRSNVTSGRCSDQARMTPISPDLNITI